MTGLQRVRRWIGEHIVLALGLLVLLYTCVPIAVVMLMSFNDNSESRNLYAFQKFTFDNWTDLCGPQGMCGSVGLSVAIAALATALATVLGALAAFALVRHRFRGRG